MQSIQNENKSDNDKPFNFNFSFSGDDFRVRPRRVFERDGTWDNNLSRLKPTCKAIVGVLLDASWHLICSEELFGFTVVEVSNEHVYRHNLGKTRHVLLHPFSQKLSGLNHFFDRVKIRSHGIDILLPAHNKSGSGVFFQKSAGNFRIIAKKEESSFCRFVV